MRFESSGLATFLLTLVKKGLADEGAELVLLQERWRVYAPGCEGDREDGTFQGRV